MKLVLEHIAGKSFEQLLQKFESWMFVQVNFINNNHDHTLMCPANSPIAPGLITGTNLFRYPPSNLQMDMMDNHDHKHDY